MSAALDHASADEAYDLLLGLVMVDDDALELLRMLVHSDVDAAELLDRYREEHIWSGSGRIEGRVWEDEPGRWVADPRGLGKRVRRAFGFRDAARRWIEMGGAYSGEVPCWTCGVELARFHTGEVDSPLLQHRFQPAPEAPH